jgi:Uma2 family endonuclease
MATELLTSAPDLADGCVEFRGVGWDGYKTMLRLRGDRSSPRLVYLDGDLWLMSPAMAHERRRSLLGSFVAQVALGLRIPFFITGQASFRRRKHDAGVEPDASFYLASEPLDRAKIQGRKKIDLRVDPPPDLAIEAVHTNSAEPAIEVLRRLGVPEVWVCDDNALKILILGEDGSYLESEISRAFSSLKAAEIFDWVERPRGDTDLDWLLELQAWIREVLLPRSQGKCNSV